jgi:thioredoxin reductase
VIVQPVPETMTTAEDEAARARELAADADASRAPESRVAPPARTDPGTATEEIGADSVYLLTGYRADVDLLCRAGIRLTDRDAPTFDPETFETNVPGLFVAGGAIAGVDTGTIFIENGRFHGEKIIEVIAGRLQ